MLTGSADAASKAGAAEAEATEASEAALAQHCACPTVAAAGGDISQAHQLLTGLRAELRIGALSLMRYADAAESTLEALLSRADAASADGSLWDGIERLLRDDDVLGVHGLAGVRAKGEALLRERNLTAAAAANRAVVTEAVAAAAARRGVQMDADSYAQATLSFGPLAACYPPTFDGREEHTPAEIAAVNRHLIVGLMLEVDDMSQGQRALYDELPAAEQESWADVRQHLAEQHDAAVSIHGECEEVEQLDRATRTEIALLVNERLTYHGVPIFHCYARVEIYLARLLKEDIVDADTFQRRIDRLLGAGMGIGELFWLNQCPQSGADKLIWSIELNMHACHLLLSSVVGLDGRILLMSEVGALLCDLLSREFPDQFDQAHSTFSTTSADSALRHAPVIRFDQHVQIINGEVTLSAAPGVLAGLAAGLRAPMICSRVSSTEGGVGQSVTKARKQGGRFQKKAAGEPGSKRSAIAKKSLFFKSRANDKAPYVKHTQLLPLGGIGFMAHIVRDTEKMGTSRGVQWPWLAAALAAGAAAAAPAETVGEAEPATAAAGPGLAAAVAAAAGSPPTIRRPLAPLDKNSAAVQRSAPGQQGGSASQLALLQLGTCEEPQLVDMIEALLVAHPELAPEVRQMLVPER